MIQAYRHGYGVFAKVGNWYYKITIGGFIALNMDEVPRGLEPIRKGTTVLLETEDLQFSTIFDGYDSLWVIDVINGKFRRYEFRSEFVSP